MYKDVLLVSLIEHLPVTEPAPGLLFICISLLQLQAAVQLHA